MAEAKKKRRRKGPRFETIEAREHHLTKVARGLLRNKTQVELGKELGFSRQQIHYDGKLLIERWRKQSMSDIGKAKAIELAKLFELEREYWEAWERSKKDGGYDHSTVEVKDGAQDAKTGKVTGGKVNRRENKRTHKRDGDHRFLEGVERCIEKRCRIWGIIDMSPHGNAVGDPKKTADARRRADAEIDAMLEENGWKVGVTVGTPKREMRQGNGVAGDDD